MALLDSAERHTAEAIVGIAYCNPFLPRRVELERQALVDDYVDGPPVKQRRAGLSWAENFPNSATLRDRAKTLLSTMRQRLVDGEPATETDLVLYEDVGLVALYLQYAGNLGHGMFGELREHKSTVAFWNEFRNEFLHFFVCPGRTLPSAYDPAHVFACLYQIERAFSYIFDYIVGGSMPAAKLRASVWQSIFTHDMRRYGRALYRCMGDAPTLILGPSGTGKELVARAIGLSRYIPFDPESGLFLTDYKGSFHAVNVAAFAPTLVESDLFGHRKGAFTGAIADRLGWFEASDPYMIPVMGSAQQNRRRSPFLFASFSFVHGCGYVDNSVPSWLAFPALLCGMMGREAEMLATVGLVKPVPKMPPASLPKWLPQKTVDYLGHKPGFRKSGQAATPPIGRA